MNKTNLKTLQDLLVAAAENFGDKTYLKEKHGKEIVGISFAGLAEDARKVSRFLTETTEHSDFHAAIIGATSIAWITAYFGTVCCGGIAVPLDAQMQVDDLCDHLNRSDSDFFFFDKLYLPMLPKIRQNCPRIHTYVCLQDTPDEKSLSEILAEYVPMQWKELDPESCTAILFTSGTTGKSKGVMLSHRNLIDNTMCQDNESSPEETILTVLPIHHVYCFTCDILLSMRYGATVCINDSMMRIVQNMKLFHPTILLVVPMIAETIYKQLKAAAVKTPDIPIETMAKATFGGNIKGIYSGGAYLNPRLAETYLSWGIPIAQGYGMTECSPRITSGDFNDPCIGSVSRIVNGCSVKIVDGEIWAKSPSVMMGYYKNPEATAEALTDDGWLKTGDLGYVDENNLLYITGRKKNLIILSNGENVSPEELENKFDGLDWASEVLIYAENGQICAEIFPNQDFLAEHGKDAVIRLFREKVAEINQTVSPAKAIRQLRLRENEFLKTTSKKIKREQPEQGKLCS